MPCILNAANEKAVAAFLDGKIRFTEMPELVARVMEKAPFLPSPSLSDLVETNSEALSLADAWLRETK